MKNSQWRRWLGCRLQAFINISFERGFDPCKGQYFFQDEGGKNAYFKTCLRITTLAWSRNAPKGSLVGQDFLKIYLQKIQIEFFFIYYGFKGCPGTTIKMKIAYNVLLWTKTLLSIRRFSHISQN